jgi:hypothetical protein
VLEIVDPTLADETGKDGAPELSFRFAVRVMRSWVKLPLFWTPSGR